MFFSLWQLRLLHKESALCSHSLNLELLLFPVISARTERENVWLPLLFCSIMLALKAPEFRGFSCRADLSSGCFLWSLAMWCCWYASAQTASCWSWPWPRVNRMKASPTLFSVLSQLRHSQKKLSQRLSVAYCVCMRQWLLCPPPRPAVGRNMG